MKQSENASRADNQQERLIEIGWLVGFTDGEGCFSLGVVRQPNKEEPLRNKAGIRKGYKTGYQVFHEFAVT